MIDVRGWAGLACVTLLAAGLGFGQTKADEPAVRFRNVATAARLDFSHHYSPAGGKIFVESAPGGLAVFDYNGDGRPDIFFTNGAETPSLQKTVRRLLEPALPERRQHAVHGCDRRRRRARRRLRMGAAAADYDNDGHVDLFVAGAQQNQLLRNRGDGRFEDVTKQAGIASGEWSVAGGWFDYDNDGRLDLFVVNYVQWSAETNRSCGDAARGVADLLRSANVQRAAQSALSQPRRRHVRGRLGARRDCGTRRQGHERRAGGLRS